jgi:hypothetical protein
MSCGYIGACLLCVTFRVCDTTVTPPTLRDSKFKSDHTRPYLYSLSPHLKLLTNLKILSRVGVTMPQGHIPRPARPTILD